VAATVRAADLGIRSRGLFPGAAEMTITRAMTGGVLLGAVASYGLIAAARNGQLAEAMPRADWAPWLWAGALALTFLMLAAAYVRMGRGVCAAVPVGCVAAAVYVREGGQGYLVAPLLLVATTCVLAYGMAVMLEQRMRRPA
jgi:hypothetical protein